MPIRQDRPVADFSPELMCALNRTVSAPRWKTYQTATGFRDDVAHLLYLWNAAVGQSFHFPLQAVEVALRNVVNQALCQVAGDNWWSERAGRQIVGDDRCGDIDKAATRLRRKYGASPDTGQIVASLMLGFWAAMLKREYNRPIWDSQAATAFPHLGPRESIRDVRRVANATQDLRNRIFHHEPLIGRSLSDDYGNILRLVGWICPVTKEWVRHHASVPTVIRQKPR